jgi:hypothetical protein
MNAELVTKPQPIQNGVILPPEIHKAVQKWGNSFFRASIPTNLIEKSVVTEINDERAKLLTAQFLYGERHGCEKDIPYDDSEIKNTINDLNVETLWLYGGKSTSEAPTGFSEKSLKKFQIETGKTKKCSKCRGEGVVTCSKCKGTGYYKENSSDFKSKPCSCDNGKRRCRACEGYRYVHTVIEVETAFKIDNSRKHDYSGEIPEKKLKKASGKVIFDESVDYPKDKMTKVLQGGIYPQEYSKLQENVSELFHFIIVKKLTDYDGDMKMVHTLVDDFLKEMPNACEKNQLLKHEILPVRIGFKIEDAPVKCIAYTYKEKPYILWVYGNERRVYAKKCPRGFTWRLVISWTIQIIIVGLIIYWLTKH